MKFINALHSNYCSSTYNSAITRIVFPYFVFYFRKKDKKYDIIIFLSPDDFRIFCGDLGNEVNDDILARAFSRYPSFLKAKVVLFSRVQWANAMTNQLYSIHLSQMFASKDKTAHWLVAMNLVCSWGHPSFIFVVNMFWNSCFVQGYIFVSVLDVRIA